MDYREVTEIRDGMRIDWDMPIPTDDGIVLRCDLYRPIEDGKYPVIMTYGPYGKWLHFDDLYHDQWRRMCESHPDVPTGSLRPMDALIAAATSRQRFQVSLIALFAPWLPITRPITTTASGPETCSRCASA